MKRGKVDCWLNRTNEYFKTSGDRFELLNNRVILYKKKNVKLSSDHLLPISNKKEKLFI